MEWPNYNENDLSVDHSVMTGVGTDGIFQTSPSDIALAAVPEEPKRVSSELHTDAKSSDNNDLSSLDSYDISLEQTA